MCIRKGGIACRWHAAKFGTPRFRSSTMKILSQELGRLMRRFDAAVWSQAMNRFFDLASLNNYDNLPQSGASSFVSRYEGR
jgi:hypothetical protein